MSSKGSNKGMEIEARTDGFSAKQVRCDDDGRLYVGLNAYTDITDDTTSKKLLTDSDGHLQVDIVSGGGGGGGDATQAKQDDIITQLSTLNTNFTATNTNNIQGDVDSINVNTASMDGKMTSGSDANLSTAQQVLIYGRDSGGTLDAIKTNTQGSLKVVADNNFIAETKTIHSGSTQTISSGTTHTFTTVLDKDGASNFTIFIDSSVSTGSIDGNVDLLTSYQNSGTFYSSDDVVSGMLNNTTQYITFVNEPARYMKIKITNNGMGDLDITNIRVSFVKGI